MHTALFSTSSPNLNITHLWEPDYKKTLHCWKSHSRTFCPTQRLPNLLKLLWSLCQPWQPELHKHQTKHAGSEGRGGKWASISPLASLNTRTCSSKAPIEPSSQVSHLRSDLTSKFRQKKKHQHYCSFRGSKNLSPALSSARFHTWSPPLSAVWNTTWVFCKHVKLKGCFGLGSTEERENTFIYMRMTKQRHNITSPKEKKIMLTSHLKLNKQTSWLN